MASAALCGFEGVSVFSLCPLCLCVGYRRDMLKIAASPESVIISSDDSFWANSAIFQVCILAYNLMVWMMRINTDKGFREEPNTIRLYLIRVPAKMICRGEQWFLKLEKNFFFKSKWPEIGQRDSAIPRSGRV